MLSLAVLWVHLLLLQSLPLRLSSPDATTPKLAFATRTVKSEPLPSPAPKPLPVRKPIKKALARPVPSTTPLPPPVAPPDASTPPAQVSALVTPDVPSAPASAPQIAASDLTPPEPEAPPTPRPPRETPVQFNLDGLPGSIKLRYKVQANKFPYSLSGELVWRQDGQQYQASLSFGVFGQTRTQTSRGLIGPGGLAPERFSDKFRTEVAAHFNHEQGKVTFSANTPDAALLAGGQDRLSVLVQLAALVAGAPERFPPATTLTIQTVGPRDADLWLFTVGTMEALELPGGNVQGLKLTRNPRQAFDQQVEIWLAPALSYLPARIRILEANGDYIDLKWDASEPAGTP